MEFYCHTKFRGSILIHYMDKWTMKWMIMAIVLSFLSECCCFLLSIHPLFSTYLKSGCGCSRLSSVFKKSFSQPCSPISPGGSQGIPRLDKKSSHLSRFWVYTGLYAQSGVPSRHPNQMSEPPQRTPFDMPLTNCQGVSFVRPCDPGKCVVQGLCHRGGTGQRANWKILKKPIV